MMSLYGGNGRILRFINDLEDRLTQAGGVRGFPLEPGDSFWARRSTSTVSATMVLKACCVEAGLACKTFERLGWLFKRFGAEGTGEASLIWCSGGGGTANSTIKNSFIKG